MMKPITLLLLFFCSVLFIKTAFTQQKTAVKKSQQGSGAQQADAPWWKRNNLRVIQVNLPAYEATLTPDELVSDLNHFSANTLIINAGGIMAFYPSKLPFHYINPFMQPDMLGEVIRLCHQSNIRVIVRFDFSRAHKSIFEAHPDWFYISPKGERIINEDMYAVSMNGAYEQECLFKIVEEVMDQYPIDGIFMNMPGYQTRNSYLGIYQGIDQNEAEKKKFFEYSGGMSLPTIENKDDPTFRIYEDFKKATIEDLMARLNQQIKSKNEQVAICTYMDKFVDIIRHESQTNSLPYWPYMSSDNVSNMENSYPDHIGSNASIQQISFQSRYNAIEPEEVYIRLYENIANGSGLDISLMGDFRNYEDERNFEAFKTVYDHHKKFEPFYGKYQSSSEIAVIAPGTWPGGDAAQEYRGIQLMLKEAHLQYDIIEDSQIGPLEHRMLQYKLIILPQTTYLTNPAIDVLKKAINNGTHLLATNRSLSDNSTALHDLFGAKVAQQNNDGSGSYIQVKEKDEFPRLMGQELILVKFNMGFYEFEKNNTTYLPLLTPGRPGPPESIGGHSPTGYNAIGIKKFGNGKGALIPVNIGKLYYLHGYQEHKNIVLDVIRKLSPELFQLVETSAHPRVELILQNYTKNTIANAGKNSPEGSILHVINLTGFSGNTYFNPSTQHNITFTIKSSFKPSRVYTMTGNKPVSFTWKNNQLDFKLDELNRYEAIIIDK